MNVIDVLKERGLIEALTSEELYSFANKPLNVYCGFDPTGESLHLGHLVPIMVLAWFQRFGHTPVIVIGGATGMIGDPSGKAKERTLLDEQTLAKNIEGIKKNFHAVLDFKRKVEKPIIRNNLDWLNTYSFIEFLRDVGKYFRIGPMLAKESVRTRLSSEEGMSFTEFAYQLLQGYDFLYLHEHDNVTVQIGGSDQWGNITAGIDLVRKVKGSSTYGMTFPLLTRSDGKKFGKSEEGAIWLSPDHCSPYQFYQYLYRVTDDDVIKLMKMLTFMDMEDINSYEIDMSKEDYIPNTAQKRLAEEVARMVHGDEGLKTALRITMAVAPGSQTVLDESILERIAEELPSYTLQAKEVLDRRLVDLVVETHLLTSKRQTRNLIRNGGVYLNNEKVKDEDHMVTKKDFIKGQWLLLAVGKKNKTVICLSD
ncbi:MAG: tyrosine--tRNA ligase [Waddliaceae bacterium]